MGIYEMQKIVSCRCTHCSQDITFVVPEEKIRRGTFPIILQNQHGIPPHKLMILITQNFQVKPFEVEDVAPAPAQASVFLGELFDKIGLAPEEQETYFQCLQERPLTIAEMAQIGQMSPNKALTLAEKLADKGFFKKVDENNTYYQPIPPYAAILAQFERLAEYVHDFQDEIPRELEQSFKALDQQAKDLRDPQDFKEILRAVFGGVSAMVSAMLSQIFAKLNQGTAIVGQFWDRAKSANHLNHANVGGASSRGEEISHIKADSPSEINPAQSTRHDTAIPVATPKTYAPAYTLKIPTPPQPCEKSDIICKLEELEDKVDGFESGNDAADYIQQLRGQFQKEIGFVPVLNDLMNWINQLRHGFTWDLQGKEVLRKRVKYWEEKFTEHLSKPTF